MDSEVVGEKRMSFVQWVIYIFVTLACGYFGLSGSQKPSAFLFHT